jgi:2'-5' RNA ligase
MSDDEVSGLVFELPDEEWTAEIRRLRTAYDPDRSNFPVEITVAGSSGLGWFSPGQTSKFVAEQMQDIARSVLPFQCFFSKVEIFPDSNVYYLALKNEEPFHAFQRTLAASRLQFEPTPFAYKPHCTIVALTGGASSAAHAELAAFAVPHRGMTIRSVSLYSVNLASHACRLVSRFPLGG